MNSGLTKDKYTTNIKTHLHDFKDSRLKSSLNSDTTSSQNSNGDQFSLSAKMLIPLISSIKEENQYIEEEKSRIQEQFIQLAQLQQSLLIESQRMKDHYRKRTEDLGRLVKTISINHGHSLSQTIQLIQTYKFQNEKLCKQIQKVRNQQKLVQHDIVEASTKENVSHSQLLQLQKELSQKCCVVKQYKNRLELMNIEYRSERVHKLEDQIDQKISDISELGCKNLVTLNMLRKQKQIEGAQKPKFKRKNTALIRNLKEMRKKIDELKNQIYTQSDINEQLAIKAKQIIIDQRQHQSRLVQQLRISSSLEATNQDTLNLIKQSVPKLQVYMQELQQKNNQHNTLKQEIQSKRKDISNKKRRYQEKMRYLKDQNNKKIKETKDGIEKLTTGIPSHNANPENQQYYEEKISELKAEYQETIDDIQQMENTLKRQDNPIGEILNLEYELSKVI